MATIQGFSPTAPSEPEQKGRAKIKHRVRYPLGIKLLFLATVANLGLCIGNMYFASENNNDMLNAVEELIENDRLIDEALQDHKEKIIINNQNGKALFNMLMELQERDIKKNTI